VSERQRRVVWMAVLAAAMTGLYPPWACMTARGFGVAIGYSWIFSPPQGTCYAVAVDTSRFLIQWAVVAIVAAALYWVGWSPKQSTSVPKLAKLHSKFPWTQAAEGVYLLIAPGTTVFIEVNQPGEYAVFRRSSGAAPEGCLIFDEPADAFAYGDALVPDEVVQAMFANARKETD
jgi:hypothetical protein